MQRNLASKFAASIAALFLLITSASAQAELQQGDALPGELIVMFFDDVDAVKIGLEHGMEFSRELSNRAHVHLYAVPVGQEAQYLQALRADSRVEAAQLNHVVADRATEPNDPLFGQQWHHLEGGDHDIDSDEAWDVTTGGTAANGARIVVCVLEGGGTAYGHDDLIDNHWTNDGEIADNGVDDDNNGFVDDYNGWNATNGTDNISNGGHGTSVSGMIGATGDNGSGGAGVNWDVEIMQVQMGGLSESNVIMAYNYPLEMRALFNASAGAQGAFVVATNASWGIDLADPANFPVWCAYYDDLGAVGILNCGATANAQYDIDTQGDMPTGCSSDYMVSVTATNDNDVRTFSGYGATTIDLGAPGEDVYLPAGGGSSYGTTSGTSFASPCVAGAIALVYSAPCTELMDLVMANPQAGADMVLGYILDGVDVVDNLVGETVTGGRLNVANSVNLALAGCGPLDCTPLGSTAAVECVYNAEMDTVVTTILFSPEMATSLCSTDSICWAENLMTGGEPQGYGAWTCAPVALGSGDELLYSNLMPGAQYAFYFTVDSLVSDTLEVSTPNCAELVSGCMEMDASNYTPEATIDDGSCVYPCVDFTFTLSTDCWAAETGWVIVDSEGLTVAEVTTGDYTDDASDYSFTQCLLDGCYAITITDSYGDGLNGTASPGCDTDGSYFATDSSGATLFTMPYANFGDAISHDFCLPATYGCTSTSACNYDADANADDGSCIFTGQGEISGPLTPIVGDTTTYIYVASNPDATIEWYADGGQIIQGQGTATVVVVWGSGEIGFDGFVLVTATDSLLDCIGNIEVLVTVADFIDDVAELAGEATLAFPCTLWPNPSSGATHLDFGEVAGEVRAVELFDVVGRLLFAWGAQGGIGMEMQLENLPVGSYQVRVRATEVTQVVALIIKR